MEEKSTVETLACARNTKSPKGVDRMSTAMSNCWERSWLAKEKKMQSSNKQCKTDIVIMSCIQLGINKHSDDTKDSET